MQSHQDFEGESAGGQKGAWNAEDDSGFRVAVALPTQVDTTGEWAVSARQDENLHLLLHVMNLKMWQDIQLEVTRSSWSSGKESYFSHKGVRILSGFLT
jgi:hypothetical protein